MNIRQHGHAAGSTGAHDITRLLQAGTAGDKAALERLWAIMHVELKRIPRRYMNRERRQHTLQPTMKRSAVHSSPALRTKLMPSRTSSEPLTRSREYYDECPSPEWVSSLPRLRAVPPPTEQRGGSPVTDELKRLAHRG
ncbi:MAG: ECF-type sigma factor [Bryobacteraceae bacterium]